jgi:HlyD family secretion protein
MKKKLFFGCLLPLIFIGGLSWWGMRALRGADTTPSRYDTVSKGDVEIKVTETGTIEALKKVEIKSKVAGRVINIRQEGTRVKVGDLLAEIEPTEIDSQIAQIKAQLDGARARLEQSGRNANFQVDSTRSAIAQAEETLTTARLRLKVALEQNSMQPRLSRSSVDQAEANLRTAKESLAIMESSTHPQAIVQAESDYENAKAAEENSRSNFGRQQKLLDKGFVSQQVVDTAKAELASTTARLQQTLKRKQLIEEQNRLELSSAKNRVKQEESLLETAKANTSQVTITNHELNVARSAVANAEAGYRVALAGKIQFKMRGDEIREAQASVTQLQNQLEEVLIRKRDTSLKATMSGVITKRYVEQGEIVTSAVGSFSSGTPVLQIADLSHMLVKMSVNEVDVQKIHAGLPVEITIDAARSAVFNGHVTRVAPAAIGAANPSQEGQAQGGGNAGGNSVVRFAVEIAVNRPDDRLKPGMSARCNIIISRKNNVLRLPNGSVEGDGNKAKVQIVSKGVKDGKPADIFTSKSITAGLRGDSHVEILDGLKEGDRIKPGAFTGPKRKSLGMDVAVD